MIHARYQTQAKSPRSEQTHLENDTVRTWGEVHENQGPADVRTYVQSGHRAASSTGVSPLFHWHFSTLKD